MTWDPDEVVRKYLTKGEWDPDAVVAEEAERFSRAELESAARALPPGARVRTGVGDRLEVVAGPAPGGGMEPDYRASTFQPTPAVQPPPAAPGVQYLPWPMQPPPPEQQLLQQMTPEQRAATQRQWAAWIARQRAEGAPQPGAAGGLFDLGDIYARRAIDAVPNIVRDLARRMRPSLGPTTFLPGAPGMAPPISIPEGARPTARRPGEPWVGREPTRFEETFPATAATAEAARSIIGGRAPDFPGGPPPISLVEQPDPTEFTDPLQAYTYHMGVPVTIAALTMGRLAMRYGPRIRARLNTLRQGRAAAPPVTSHEAARLFRELPQSARRQFVRLQRDNPRLNVQHFVEQLRRPQPAGRPPAMRIAGRLPRGVTQAGYVRLPVNIRQRMAERFGVTRAVVDEGIRQFRRGMTEFLPWREAMLASREVPARYEQQLAGVWNGTERLRSQIQREEGVPGVEAPAGRRAAASIAARELGMPPDEGRVVRRTESELLRDVLRREERGARLGAREIVQIHRELTDAARDLPVDQQGSVMRAIAGAQTPEQVGQILNRIARLSARAERRVIMSPGQLLRYAMRHEVRGGTVGYRAGRLDMHATRQALVQFAQENLPAEEQRLIARVMTRIAGMAPTRRWEVGEAEPSAAVRSIINAVNRMAANHERASAVLEVVQALRANRPRGLRPRQRTELEQLLHGIRLVRQRPETLRRMQSVIDAESRETTISQIPQRIVDRALQTLEQQDWRLLREMEPQAIRDLAARITQIGAESRRLTGEIQRRRGEALRDDITAATSEAERLHPARYPDEPRRRQNPLLRIPWRDQLSVRTVMEDLTGRGGSGFRVMYRDMERGESRALEIGQAAEDHVQQLIRTAGVSAADLVTWSDALSGGPGTAPRLTIRLPEATDARTHRRIEHIRLTRGQLIDLYNLLHDPERRAVLLRHQQRGFVFHAVGAPTTYRLTIADARAILEATPADVRTMAAGLSGYVNGPLREHPNEVRLLFTGRELAALRSYWPSERLRQTPREIAELTNPLERFMAVYLDELSALRHRTRAMHPLVIRDGLARFNMHVNNMAAYAGRFEPTVSAEALLNDPNFVRAVQGGMWHGNDVLQEMRQMVREYQGMDMRTASTMEQAIGGFMRGAHIGALGLKPQIVAYQTVSLGYAANEIPARYLFSTQNPGLRQRAATHEMMMRHPQFRARLTSRGHGIITASEGGRGLAEFYGVPGSPAERAGMGPIHRADSQVMYQIYGAAIMEGRTNLVAEFIPAGAPRVRGGLTGRALEEYAGNRAWDVVAQTQPVWGILDRAAMVRHAARNPALLPFVAFASQRSQIFNMVAREGMRYRQSGRTPRDLGRMLSRIARPIIGGAIALTGIRYGVQRGWEALAGRRDRRTFTDHLEAVVARILGPWLVVGDAVVSAQRIVRGALQRRDLTAVLRYGMRHNILTSTVVEGGAGIYNLVRTIADAYGAVIENEASVYQAGERRGELRVWDSLANTVRSATDVSAMIFGLPLQGVRQAVWPQVQQFLRPQAPATPPGPMQHRPTPLGGQLPPQPGATRR